MRWADDKITFKKKMRLNGSDLRLYVTDSVSTIESRIAASFHSLPDWLVFRPKRPTSVSEYAAADVTVSDYLHDVVLNQQSMTVPPGPYPDSIAAERVKELFIATNSTLENTADRFRAVLLSQIENADTIWRKRTAIVGLLNKAIRDNENESAQFEEVADSFESAPAVEFTPFEIRHVQFTVNFGPYAGTLLDLFDAFSANEIVPYAAVSGGVGQFFKVHTGFKVSPDWVEADLTDVLLLKVNADANGPIPSNRKSYYNSFTNVAFAVQNGNLFATMDSNVGSRFVTKRALIDRVTPSFPAVADAWNVVSVADNLVIAYYSIPNQCLDPYVFGEMAMNDSAFVRLIAIDEFTRPTKIVPSVYVHRLGEKSTVTMTLKQTTKPNEYGADDWYVRCRIRTTDTNNIVPLQTVIAKLFSYYNSEIGKIVSYYKRYYPPWNPQLCAGPKRPKRAIVAKGLRAIAPEVFFPTYSRKCANPPVVVGPDYVGETMDFPNKGETVDGVRVPTRTYACIETSHPHVGLRRNELGNKDVFPAVPCCFKRDQINKTGSAYRLYYSGETGELNVRQFQDTEAYRKRVLDPGDTEVLPEDIVRLFSLIEPDPDVTFVRNGINRTKWAAIEAVLFGRGQVAYKRMRSSTVVNRVTREATRMIDVRYAMAAKQELYNLSADKILDEIRASDLRPSRFVHALETLLDCNIFVFTSSRDEPKGRLVVPEHAAFYLKYKPNRETFLLYEYYDADDVPYPAIELITRTEGGAFLPGDEVILRLFSIFGRLTKSYVLGGGDDGGNREIIVPRFPRFNVTAQLVDGNGKCRVVVVDDVIAIVTDPLPPFAAPPIVTGIPPRVDAATATRFLTDWKLVPQRQRKGEVSVTIGNVGCVVLIERGARLNGVRVEDRAGAYDDLDATSAIASLSQTKRTANVLFQYTLKAIGPIVDRIDVDAKLSRVRFKINPNARYTIESQRFDSNPTFVTPTGEIIVPSDETRKRLLFAARIVALYRPQTLASYGDTINGYFANARDFVDRPDVIVLGSKMEIKNLLETYAPESRTFYATVQPQLSVPYFFKNKALSADVYLAVPVESLANANAAVESWSRLGYRDRSTVAAGTDARPPVYSADDYALLSDGDADYDGLVLAYTAKNSNGRYVALLGTVQRDL